jgi:DNA-binding GntR family transcriptional regulator
MISERLHAKPQRRALGEWAVDTLYEQIFTGQLSAGADMGEELLSERLEVSRATVAFALRQLELDGVIEVAAGNGRRQVATFATGDIADLYNVRLALESFTAGQAALRIAPESIEKLERLQDEMEALSPWSDRPSTRDFGVDFDLHRIIARESGSPRAVTALQPIWNQTHALLRHLHSISVYADAVEDAASYRDHRAIIAALARHDAEGSRCAMVEHLTVRRESLIAALERRGGLVQPELTRFNKQN